MRFHLFKNGMGHIHDVYTIYGHMDCKNSKMKMTVGWLDFTINCLSICNYFCQFDTAMLQFVESTKISVLLNLVCYDLTNICCRYWVVGIEFFSVIQYCRVISYSYVMHWLKYVNLTIAKKLYWISFSHFDMALSLGIK